MNIYEKTLTTKLICLLFIFLIVGTTDISAQKKSAAQISAESEIDSKRSEVNALKSEISLKKAEINSKQAIFDQKKAAYAAEEERINAKDAAVKDRESCMSNLLADILPSFGSELITEYAGFRSGGDPNKKIDKFAFGEEMKHILAPAYMLAYKEYLSTFRDATDRAAFNAYAEETFDLYYLGGLDRSGDTIDGILCEHFHPKYLAPGGELAQNTADKYIKSMSELSQTDGKTINMAKAMPTEFYVGWDRFVNDCGMPLVHIMKGKRRKQRVPEVEAQQKLGAELRMDFLELKQLREELKAMEGDLYIIESNLKYLQENYLKAYKRSY